MRAPGLLDAEPPRQDSNVPIGGGEEEGVGAGGYGGDGGGGEDGGVGVGRSDLGCFEEIEGFPLEGLVG